MSTQHLVKLVTSVTVGFFVGFLSMKALQRNNSSSNLSSGFSGAFSSKLNSPSLPNGRFGKGPILELGKIHMLTTIKILVPERAPASEDDVVELKGFVTLHEELNRPLFWEWSLPEGVTLVEGKTKDYEAQALAGRTYTTTIKVKGFSRQQHKIIALSGFADYEESRQGNSATVSSNPEASLEFVAPALKAEVDLDKMKANDSVNKRR